MNIKNLKITDELYEDKIRFKFLAIAKKHKMFVFDDLNKKIKIKNFENIEKVK